MALVVLGLNHNTAPVEVREKIAFNQKHLQDAAEQIFASIKEVDEKVILSTCNRVEIYAHVEETEAGIEALKKFIYRYHEVEQGILEPYFYTYTFEDAVEHLFKVSSSLDSMVIGEPQILGQVKDAYQNARKVKATGKILNQLFEKAFFVAKKIRSETSIAENAVSISYAAVELAERIFGRLEGRSVLLIGAGEMIQLAGKHLLNQGVKTILVSNHNHGRAVQLARELGGSAVEFDRFIEQLAETDIVISSTAAPHYVIKRAQVEKAMKMRHGKPIFLIDIAVPRDIEPSTNELENVFLYDIDDLSKVVASNRIEREKEAERALKMIKEEVGRFTVWLEQLEMEPMIVAIRKKAEEIKERELSKTFSRAGLDERQKEAVSIMASSIINKILHDPTLHLKKQTAPGNDPHHRKTITEAVKNLFNIE
ncbi:MAG: glutamyl-tRNA reductase [Nitrospinae bacterium]|nr:glutamyl-tRNA reductase [Nitrospinota bacterium]